MKNKLLVISISLSFFGSVGAVNWKTLDYYGDVVSGTVFSGRSVTEDRVRELVSFIDVLPTDPKPPIKTCLADMTWYFKDENSVVQELTIRNFESYYEHAATAEERYALLLLVRNIIEHLS